MVLNLRKERNLAYIISLKYGLDSKRVKDLIKVIKENKHSQNKLINEITSFLKISGVNVTTEVSKYVKKLILMFYPNIPKK